MTASDIVREIERHRLPLSDEKRLQAEIEVVLLAKGAKVQREVRLGTGDIIDFVIGDSIGIEVKINGARRKIYRQCERYAQYPEVRSLVLATNVAMGMPAEIAGKPVLIANLGKAWM